MNPTQLEYIAAPACDIALYIIWLRAGCIFVNYSCRFHEEKLVKAMVVI